MLLTLSQVKQGPVGRSSGVPTDTVDFVNIVNDATRQLISRGGWWTAVQPMSLTVTGNQIICPSFVESILALKDGFGQGAVQNFWYSFLSWDNGLVGIAKGCTKESSVAYQSGFACVTNQIDEKNPMYVRLTSSSPSDVGIQITVIGLDANGLNTACTMTLASPFVSSASQNIVFSKVTKIIKPFTNGYITANQDDNNGNLLPLSLYAPNEVNPTYVVMTLNRFRNISTSVQALVKLAFVPVSADNDTVIIENQDALRDMVLAIRKKEAGDLAASKVLEASAIRELNYQLRSRFPDQQTVVSVRPFGVKEINTVTNIV